MAILPVGIGASGPTQFQIERSLRFNSADSAYLNRTPASAGNRKTWTWSGWVKKATNGITACMFGAGGSDGAVIRFETNDTIRCYDYSGSFAFNLQTTQVFRDPSAWYHVVLNYDSTQSTSSDRVKLYVNGSQITAFSSSTYPSLNQDAYFFNNNVLHRIGAVTFVNSNYLDGYLTEVYFIDGSAKTPSDFGENDTDTGVWKPKAYSGTYGTNGFYLKFADNSGTTSTTLGKDSSGNGNNWTPNNFSVTAGAGNDSLVDTPTPYGSDTGAGGEVRGNYCTWNAVDGLNATLTNGNLDASVAANTANVALGTISVSSGKWYWEITPTGGTNYMIGVADASVSASADKGWTKAYGWYYYLDGNKYSNNSSAAYGASYTTNDVIGVALDMDAGTLTFYKNGSSQGTAYSVFSGKTIQPSVNYGAGASAQTYTANFGQRPFAYTAPSGFKALCTTNLPTPAIGATSTTRAGKYFNTVLYTGNGGNLSVTGVGFQPDFNWVKSRSNAGTNHLLEDVIRGTKKSLISNGTNAELTRGINSFDSDGFSFNDDGAGDGNSNGQTYVSWNWKANGAGSSNTQGTITSTVSANTTSGFSIVTYTGTGSNATVGHGLGAAPQMIIVKSRSYTDIWPVYHQSIGNTQFLRLQGTNGAGTFNVWQNTNPTSSVFYISTDTTVNTNTATYVAYCFAPVAGYSAFGAYNGNGSSDGPFIYMGFRPAFMLVKQSSATGEDWWIYDNKRDTYNIVDNILAPNLSGAEISGGTYPVDFLSNGFKIRGLNALLNTNGATYVYAAFAEHPFKYALAR